MMKKIPNFPNYAVTQKGQVWSIRFNRFLKQTQDTDGYYIVGLRENKKKKTQTIHKIVLDTYVGSCPRGMVCRHLNGIKTDNRVSNLSWGTMQENCNDREIHGRTSRGENHTTAKLKGFEVLKIRKLYKNKQFNQTKLAKMFNVSQGNIWKIISGNAWKHLIEMAD